MPRDIGRDQRGQEAAGRMKRGKGDRAGTIQKEEAQWTQSSRHGRGKDQKQKGLLKAVRKET